MTTKACSTEPPAGVTWTRLRSALAWRAWYYRTQIGKGILRRFWLYPRVLATAKDCWAYLRLMASLDRRSPPVSLAVKELKGRSVLCRPGTSDPWVLWDTFYNRFHLPPAGVRPRCILDLGANVGYTACHFAALYEDAQVFAVELDAGNARLATQNLAGFGPRCRLVQAAVWSSDGEVHYAGGEEQGFRVTTASSRTGTTANAVPARCLDTLFHEFGLEHVDYVKMDIEGAEAMVMRGSLEWAKRVGAMKIEIHEPATFEELAAALTPLGFRCHRDTAHSHCLVAVR